MGDINKKMSQNLRIFSYPSVITFVFSAQKNRLIKTVDH